MFHGAVNSSEEPFLKGWIDVIFQKIFLQPGGNNFVEQLTDG